MKQTLLIGNGLNLCLDHSISWGDLLKDIASDYDVKYNGSIPMPLEFESIVNQCLSKKSDPSDSIYLEIKEKIVEKISYAKLPLKAIHHEIYNLPIDAIMTTNYDNLLEYVYNPECSYKGSKAYKYLFNATSTQHNIFFYHIHGHADSPKTLCLGYEHYMGVVENMRREINSKEDRDEDKMKIKEVLFGNSKRRNTWDERFYTDNIGIIGLGLSESEVDLWWLLAHRAYLYYSNYCNIRKVLKNKITYYDVLNPNEPEWIEQKKKIHYMLNNSHVEVKKYIIGTDCMDYKDGYRKIMQDIRNGGLS